MVAGKGTSLRHPKLPGGTLALLLPLSPPQPSPAAPTAGHSAQGRSCVDTLGRSPGPTFGTRAVLDLCRLLIFLVGVSVGGGLLLGAACHLLQEGCPGCPLGWAPGVFWLGLLGLAALPVGPVRGECQAGGETRTEGTACALLAGGSPPGRPLAGTTLGLGRGALVRAGGGQRGAWALSGC